jgi:hypothetical protein
VQLKVGTLVANAVRVASSGSKYAGCGQEAADSTATRFNWNPAEQSALVTIEPVEQTIMANGEDSPQQCTWEGRLRWVDGLGFRVRKLHDLCKAVAQDVSIDQQGNISTKPRQRDQQ